MTLWEVVHAHVPTLSPESTVRDAVDKMDVYQFPALVVADDEGRPIGVVTEGDLCRAVSSHGSLTALGTQPVMPFSTPSPTTMGLDAEVSEAFHTMLSRGLTLLPVVDEGRLAGVVLRVDLMQAILMDTDPVPGA